jgi:hypothetical protein
MREIGASTRILQLLHTDGVCHTSAAPVRKVGERCGTFCDSRFLIVRHGGGELSYTPNGTNIRYMSGRRLRGERGLVPRSKESRLGTGVRLGDLSAASHWYIHRPTSLEMGRSEGQDRRGRARGVPKTKRTSEAQTRERGGTGNLVDYEV